MNIFISGGSGFIGRAFSEIAISRGHRVLALCRNSDAALPAGVEVALGSLNKTPWRQVERFAPEVVLHLAWLSRDTGSAPFFDSTEHDIWCEQSKVWFKRIKEMGDIHIAGTGTCLEYGASPSPLSESSSRLDQTLAYSRAKFKLFQWLIRNGDGTASSWSWFRVFNSYGPGENPNRICSSLISHLGKGRRLVLRTPHDVKDYIFNEDVAKAMCLALEVKLTGAINIGTGKGISIKDLAVRVAAQLEIDASLVQNSAELEAGPHSTIVADINRIRSIGWKPQVSLNQGLQRLIQGIH